MGIGSPNPLLLASTASGGEPPDPVTRSLRLDGSSSGLSRDPASDGDSQKFTFACWIKRTKLGATQRIFSSAHSTADDRLAFKSDDTLEWNCQNNGTSLNVNDYTKAVFRDVSAFYHICLSVDTTQATPANRIKLYVNGVLQEMNGSNQPAQNTTFGLMGTGYVHTIGSYTSSSEYLGGYLADVYFLDGTQVAPIDNFIESNDYGGGGYKPKEYTGSFGTNGFHLKFDDSSDIGADSTSNSNDFTATNLSSHDAMLDAPTRNYATFNPLTESGATYSEGNTKINCYFDNANGRRATVEVSSGKWYWEVLRLDAYGNVGVFDCSNNTVSYYAGYSSSDYGMSMMTLGFYRNGSQTSTSNTTGSGDIVQFALDVDAGKLWIGKNGTWFESGDPSAGTNAIYDSDISGRTWSPTVGQNYSAISNFVLNAGADPTFANNKPSGQDTTQDEFYYAPPTGFSGL